MENSSIPPNQTLYITHLNEKIKLDELKTSLFQLCSQYGEVLEIIASKAIKRRGQAFIVFKNINTAIKAEKELNDALLFGKRISVSFSKSTSDSILKSQGLLSQEAKAKLQSERKNRRDMEYKAMRERIIEQKEKELKSKYNPNSQYPPGFNVNNINYNSKSIDANDYSEKNSILFIEDLPKDIDENQLKSMFDRYSGFKELRLHSGRGVCFVEYDNEINAESAMIGLSETNLNDECILNISFAKK